MCLLRFGEEARKKLASRSWVPTTHWRWPQHMATGSTLKLLPAPWPLVQPRDLLWPVEWVLNKSQCPEIKRDLCASFCPHQHPLLPLPWEERAQTSPAPRRGVRDACDTDRALGFLVCAQLSHVQLFATPWTVAHQAPLSMGFSKQEYWNGLLFPPPQDLLYPGIKHMSAALASRCFTTEPSEAREEIQSRLYWSSCYSRGNKNKQQIPLLAPWVGWGGEGGQADSLYGARVAMCPWVRSEGRLKWFAHPFGGGVCRGHEQYPAFAPSSSDTAVGWLLGCFVLFFGIFVSCCP